MPKVKHYDEWLKYRKWYEKQQRKGFTMSARSLDWYENYSEFIQQREYVAQIRKEDEAYKNKSILETLQSRSYESSSRQTEYFYDRVAGVLAELERESAEGDSSATEKLNDFFAKFGDIRTADKQQIIYEHLKQGALEYRYQSRNDRGWYGNLMDMMVYFQNNGVIDQIYV